MLASAVRMARDYNRALPAPIRAIHIAAAALAELARPITAWARHPRRRAWAAPLLLGAILFLLLWPLDPIISRGLRAIPMGGDIRRELEAWQQYGALGSLLLTAALIWILDPPRRPRLLDLAAAAVAVAIACWILKSLVGRPRPGLELGDAWTILGPWGMFPVPGPSGTWVLRHAWQSGGSSAALWSMPSSHTAAAVVLSVFLSALYPRLRGLGITLAVIVGFARIKLGAHWPTDVAIGATLGYALTAPAVAERWGQRLAAWLNARRRAGDAGGRSPAAAGASESLALGGSPIPPTAAAPPIHAAGPPP